MSRDEDRWRDETQPGVSVRELTAADLDRYAALCSAPEDAQPSRERRSGRASLQPHGHEDWDGPAGECGLDVQEPPRTPNIGAAAGANGRPGCALGPDGWR
jgi:hypothetical protein